MESGDVANKLRNWQQVVMCTIQWAMVCYSFHFIMFVLWTKFKNKYTIYDVRLKTAIKVKS